MSSIVTKTYDTDVPTATLQTVDNYCLFIFVYDMSYTLGLVLWRDLCNMHQFSAILLLPNLTHRVQKPESPIKINKASLSQNTHTLKLV